MSRLLMTTAFGLFYFLSTSFCGSALIAQKATQVSSPTNRQAVPAQPTIANALEHLQPYFTNRTVSGNVQLSGSTTMNDLGVNWAEAFKKFHPQVEFAGEAAGSLEAIRAMAANPAIVAGVARPVGQSDLEVLQSGKCKNPSAFVVALDAIVVVVHKDNPISQLTSQQVSRLLTAGPGGISAIKTWADLGVSGKLANEPVELYRRNEADGTGDYINATFVPTGSIAKPQRTVSTNSEVCQEITENPRGIGFSSLHAVLPGTRSVALEVNGRSVDADGRSLLAGTYPLVRPLMLIVDQDVMKQDKGLRSEIIEFVLSRDGQSEAMRAGFYPLSASFTQKQLDQLRGQSVR